MSTKSKIILAKEIKLIFQILASSFVRAFAITHFYCEIKISNLEKSTQEIRDRQTKNFHKASLNYPNQSNLPLCYDLYNFSVFNSYLHSAHYHPIIYLEKINLTPKENPFHQIRYSLDKDFAEISSFALPQSYKPERGHLLDYRYFRQKTASDISRVYFNKELNQNFKKIQHVKNKYEFSFELDNIGSSLFWKIFFLGFVIIIIRYIIIIFSWVETTSQEKIEDD